jgi:hypothetical protein
VLPARPRELPARRLPLPDLTQFRAGDRERFASGRDHGRASSPFPVPGHPEKDLS